MTHFVGLLAVAPVIHVIRLVPDVPREDAFVLGERADDALDVSLEARVLGGVLQGGASRPLHPAGVVNARLRVALLAELRVGVPDRVEQDEHRLDPVPGGDGQELVDAFLVALVVMMVV